MADPDHRLQDFLTAGVAPDDITSLFPLLRGRELLRAFTALFHGGEDAVMVRLLVLRTLGGRPHRNGARGKSASSWPISSRQSSKRWSGG